MSMPPLPPGEVMLKRLKASEVPSIRRDPVDTKARTVAEAIVEAVKTEGETAVRRYAEQFGELAPGDKLVLTREGELREAYHRISAEQRGCLERTAARIRSFAAAQRASLHAVTVPIAGGEAGHTVEPVENAGCYAPGGRYPLPSTVLMTAVTAKVAGCKRIVVASPRPSDITLAAAYIAEADVLLPIGGAHAIAALAYGAGPVEPCDAVVGPGNQYVTAAKSLVAGRVAIDMLAGPSECIVLADESAEPSIVAKDLLAQAEHDPQALPALACLSEAFAQAVDRELKAQLEVLPTRDIAGVALKNGYVQKRWLTLTLPLTLDPIPYTLTPTPNQTQIRRRRGWVGRASFVKRPAGLRARRGRHAPEHPRALTPTADTHGQPLRMCTSACAPPDVPLRVCPSACAPRSLTRELSILASAAASAAGSRQGRDGVCHEAQALWRLVRGIWRSSATALTPCIALSARPSLPHNGPHPMHCPLCPSLPPSQRPSPHALPSLPVPPSLATALAPCIASHLCIALMHCPHALASRPAMHCPSFRLSVPRLPSCERNR